MNCLLKFVVLIPLVGKISCLATDVVVETLYSLSALETTVNLFASLRMSRNNFGCSRFLLTLRWLSTPWVRPGRLCFLQKFSKSVTFNFFVKVYSLLFHQYEEKWPPTYLISTTLGRNSHTTHIIVLTRALRYTSNVFVQFSVKDIFENLKFVAARDRYDVYQNEVVS